jgi:hypothetical protein
VLLDGGELVPQTSPPEKLRLLLDAIELAPGPTDLGQFAERAAKLLLGSSGAGEDEQSWTTNAGYVAFARTHSSGL